MRPWSVLPLPRFVLRPYTAVVIAAVHVYLGIGHLGKLFGGEVEWTHFWKGFGSIGGAYVFAALASRGLARRINASGYADRQYSKGAGPR
jgi:hypothetical protein